MWSGRRPGRFDRRSAPRWGYKPADLAGERPLPNTVTKSSLVYLE